MKHFVEFPLGGKVEIRADGCTIISTSGEFVCYGSDGKLQPKENENIKSAVWMEYFFLMGEDEREQVRKWYKEQKGETKNQKKFLQFVGMAIAAVNYNYKIATIEASVQDDGELFYKSGAPVAKNLSCREWEVKARGFAPEYSSELANLYELYLWYAYRIAKGFWSIEYVCDDSSSEGNYRNSPNKYVGGMEATGVRRVGGFCDGIGNTRKIVKGLEKSFLVSWGYHYEDGKECPIFEMGPCLFPDSQLPFSTGVLVLKSNF